MIQYKASPNAANPAAPNFVVWEDDAMVAMMGRIVLNNGDSWWWFSTCAGYQSGRFASKKKAQAALREHLATASAQRSATS